MSSQIEFIRAYLDAVEFPNKLQPNGVTRSLADLKRAGESGAKIVDRCAMCFEMRDGKLARHHSYDCFEPW